MLVGATRVLPIFSGFHLSFDLLITAPAFWDLPKASIWLMPDWDEKTWEALDLTLAFLLSPLLFPVSCFLCKSKSGSHIPKSTSLGLEGVWNLAE